MRTFLVSIFAFSALALAACGGGGDDVTPSPDAHISLPDAGDGRAVVTSGVGVPCDQNTPCPGAMDICVLTNPDTGYCTPKCFTGGWNDTTMMTAPPALDHATADPACTAGFMGPATGAIQCGLGLKPATGATTIDYVCAIACSADTDCPGQLFCKALGTGTTKICQR